MRKSSFACGLRLRRACGASCGANYRARARICLRREPLHQGVQFCLRRDYPHRH